MPQGSSALTGGDSSQMFQHKPDESRDDVICIPETVIKKKNMEDLNNNARDENNKIHINFYGGDQRVETE